MMLSHQGLVWYLITQPFICTETGSHSNYILKIADRASSQAEYTDHFHHICSVKLSVKTSLKLKKERKKDLCLHNLEQVIHPANRLNL